MRCAKRLPCPHCDNNLAGEVATWESSCPLAARCPECGVSLDWRDVFLQLAPAPARSNPGPGLPPWLANRFGAQMYGAIALAMAPWLPSSWSACVRVVLRASWARAVGIVAICPAVACALGALGCGAVEFIPTFFG